MIKKIIKINHDLCIGCSACANTCHQSAITMVNGKAVLQSEEFCDGLGRCLPVCPADAIQVIEKEVEAAPVINHCPGNKVMNLALKDARNEVTVSSNLKQWPIQIQLVATQATYFENAHLLIAADCSAYAYANFHQDFMKDKVTIIGCPKLDEVEYTHKLTKIIALNTIQSIQVVRMEVPCCGGIEHAAKQALHLSDKQIPLSVVTLTVEGTIK